LVLSTYYGQWSANSDRLARADIAWRKRGLDTDLHALLHALSEEAPEPLSHLNGNNKTLAKVLGSFAKESRRTGAGWIRILEEFWDEVGFPVIADEADTGAWRHFTTLLHRIREDLKETSFHLGDFTGLLQHLLAEELVHIRGSEEAGIQVLGIIESRGLSFDKLYVLGLSAGSLPRPVRALPFLDAWERLQVQGATVESQYIFAQEAFRHLLACAPHVTLIRPEEEAAEPLTPSPFWAQILAEETSCTIDPWNSPDSVWARATWLQQARRGLANPVPYPPDDPPVEDNFLPKKVSVSQLATAFVCPFRFYAETILKLFPLDELMMGISPLERGSRLHKALALFTRRCRDQGLVEKRDRAAMEDLLKACSDEALLSDCSQARHTDKDALGRHSRAMERRRWIGGNDEAPGLLTQWLNLELERLDEGWCWLSEESSFDGLAAPHWPFSVAGRIDRVDRHKDKGIMMWDYKSGEHPSRQAVLEYLIDPQVPAYVLAAEEHRIAEIRKELGSHRPVSGGYIVLRRPASVSHLVLRPKGGSWSPVLQRLKESVARLSKVLASGQFTAQPYPVSDAVRQEKACQYCLYRPLCGKKGFSGRT
jgi:RecB family exonuclease